jgi:glycosyltransferase involved in cell wall biosynthesis
MRIAIDTQSTVGRKTGIGYYTSELLAAMRRIAPQHEYMELDWGRDVAMRFDRRLRWQQYEAPSRARKAHADLLHVTGFDAPLWHPCPTVLTVHDLIGMLFPQNLPPVSRFYWSRWLPFTIRAADAIIADSVATRDDVNRLLGIPAERIHVVYLGVEERFRPQPAEKVAELRKRYHLEHPFILYLGTLEPRKGVDTLIDAFAQMAGAYTIDLAIAGKKGWWWESLSAQIAQHGLEQRVHFLDYVPGSELPILYSAANIFAFPSRYEGFGLPILEAMACETPVVCANTSSLPEVAGDAAILVPPNQPATLANALGKVIDEPDIATRLRLAGRARAAEFTWAKAAQATLEIYQKVYQNHAHLP